MNTRSLALSICLFLASCSGFIEVDDSSPTPQSATSQKPVETQYERVDFSAMNDRYRFSAETPKGWNVEYVPSTEAINIFDPTADTQSTLEQSQIFIRLFEADRFLTLSTVDILERVETEVRGHDAVRYRIRKKEAIAPFANQPSWRNEDHKLIDIRYAPTGRTFFYVFSYNPNLDHEVFERFIESLQFQNDANTWAAPLPRTHERTVLKPFGIKISPADSPVSPEKFSGFHTGIDYEIFEEEVSTDVPVFAICEGPIRAKREASGYGGVVVQECLHSGEVVTVLYGHIRLLSVVKSVGDELTQGERIGVLGTGYSKETDGERKHLHLAMHKGSSVELRGYVQNEQALNAWIDPATFGY